MADIRTRFRVADRIAAPDLWPDVTTRRAGEIPTPPRRSRVAIVGLGLALAGLAILVLGRAFLDSASEPTRPLPPTGSPFVPIPKENGRIAFTRIDPDSVVEGQPPEAALYTVNWDGTGLMRLTEMSARSRSTWSPDGSSIAFMDRATGGISRMQPDGGQVNRLTTCEGRGGCTVDSGPAWSPDGGSIAFFGVREGNEGIWVVSPDGGGLTAVLRSFIPGGGPTWSPDGRQMAISGSLYDAEHHGGPHRLHIVDVRSGEVVLSIRPKGRDPGEVAWSPDGEWLALHLGGPGGRVRESGIYLMRPDGNDLQLLTSWSCPTNTCSPLDPAWSPDARQLVFTAGSGELGSDGYSGDLLVIDLGTRRIHRLTQGPGLDCCATWQPVAST
jgi:dipeptidyl aminopeptidase/acylaminoacyl peptidase